MEPGRLSTATGPLSVEFLEARESARRRLFAARAQPVVIGRYAIERLIGAGGMGSVFVAHDPALGRRVAIKVLQRPRGEDALMRVRREGRALAQLGHPHVVEVFEVGVHCERPFIVMELVEGSSLRRWLANRSRSWREIVGVFVQAGEGLAAAHACGLLHLDFKPDNVLVRDDGHAKVADFGLARPLTLVTDAITPEVDGPAVAETVDRGGTPEYMAPERWRAGGVDARADIFSFCVALWEALCGQRPFQADTPQGLRAAILAGDVTELPNDRRAPRSVLRLLEGGMGRDPSSRPPAMSTLVDALRRELSSRRPTVALAVGAVLFAGAVAAPTDELTPCPRSAASETWNAQRAGVRDALLETGLAHARDTWERADAALLDWARLHDGASAAACELAAEERSSTARCLEDGLSELHGLVAALRTADAEVVRRTLSAIDALAPADRCTDASSDPRWAVAGVEIAGIRERRAAIVALVRAGRFAEALPAVRALELDAAAAPTALRAEITFERGRLERELGDMTSAESTLIQVEALAVELGLDGLAAAAEIELIDVSMSRHGSAEVALGWARRAEASLARAGVDDWRRSYALERARATVHAEAGDVPAARSAFERAARHLEGHDAQSLVGQLKYNLGLLLQNTEELEEAEVALREALDAIEHSRGRRYYLWGLASCELGATLVDRGRPDEGLVLIERGVEVLVEVFGEGNPKTLTVMFNYAGALVQVGRFADAEVVVQRVERIAAASEPRDDQLMSAVVNHLAGMALERGDLIAAAEHFARAAVLAESAFGPGHANIVVPLLNRAGVEIDLANLEVAERTLQSAAEILRTGQAAELGELRARLDQQRARVVRRREQPDLAAAMLSATVVSLEALPGTEDLLGSTLFELGLAELERGHTAAAITALERASDYARSPRQRAAVAPALARAIAASGDQVRARRIAEDAREQLSSAPGNGYRHAIAELDAVLADLEQNNGTRRSSGADRRHGR